MNTRPKRTLIGVCGGILLLLVPSFVQAHKIPSRQVKEVFLDDNDPHIPDYYDPNRAFATRDEAVLDVREAASPTPAVREPARPETNWFLRLARILHSLRMRGILR